MTHENYDPATLYHYLFWELRCFKASPMEFQHLFEEVAKRAGGHFVAVKPYGKLGDKKADGLYWSSGTVFQVYAPDAMTAAKTRRKIDQDLSGAVAEWGEELKEWVFVYNARRGVAADVPKLLQKQQGKYPGIKIRPLSQDELWRIVRGLSAQDRVEILGPPPGFERLFPLSVTLPAEAQERLRTGKFIVIQDSLSPVDLEDALGALAPAQPFGPPLYLPRLIEDNAWQLAAGQQRALVDEAIERTRELRPRFAVFSLAPIPLAIHLGYLLSDRVAVELFQYDRDRRTWQWNASAAAPNPRISVSGVPAGLDPTAHDVALRVSLSARITPEQTGEVVGRLPVEIDMIVADPDVTWLKHRDQLVAFAHEFRRVLKAVRETAPNCERIHLFFAGPTGAAIVAGQAINPRMNPPVVLYEYHRRKRPRYEAVLILN